MTLVFDAQTDGPLVHVLTIGVGAYRHLPGGDQPVEHDTLGLMQLTSPPHSLRAFTDWLVNLRHPTATLGSVEMLMSPGGGYQFPLATRSHQVEPATFANVKAAFSRWYARCDQDPGNVAILYFCGHGVESDSQYLLPEDFGANPLRLLDNCVNIGVTFDGMARCEAQRQYFIVDACREIPQELLQRLGAGGETLVDFVVGQEDRIDKAMLFATSGGAKAYGLPNQPTRYTAAFLLALDGLASKRRQDGTWFIDLTTVHNVVTALLKADPGRVQWPELHGGGNEILHLLPRTPLLPVLVKCAPTAAVGRAQPRIRGLGFYDPPPAPMPDPAMGVDGWSYQLPPDAYDFEVDFPDGSYRHAELRLHATPPGVTDVIEIPS